MACLFGLIFNVFIVKGSDGQILHDTIPAPSLKNNIIGEDTMKTIVVYLPPSYEGSEEKFPVLYFLPGWTCDYIKDNLLPDYMNDLIKNSNFVNQKKKMYINYTKILK